MSFGSRSLHAPLKWHSLKDLLKELGVDLSPLNMAGNAKYDSDTNFSELLAALAHVVKSETDRLIQASTYCGVLMDETTDVSNLGQLDMHLRLVHGGVISSRFGTVISLHERTAEAITARGKTWCTERNADLSHSRSVFTVFATARLLQLRMHAVMCHL